MELFYLIIIIVGVAWFIRRKKTNDYNNDTNSNWGLNRNKLDDINSNSGANRPSIKTFNYKNSFSKSKLNFNDTSNVFSKSLSENDENFKIFECKGCRKKLRVSNIPKGKSGIIKCPSCKFENQITIKNKRNINKKKFDFDGINDAYTGLPINPAKLIYSCKCGVFYHAESYEVILQENNSKCMACSKNNISLFNNEDEISINISRPRNHSASVITLLNYKNYLNRVVTFEGKVKNILQSRSGTSYAVMFEDKSWTKGFKLVFFRDAVSQYGGVRYIRSLEGRTIKVRGLLIKHHVFGYEIVINEKSMIKSIK